jgi:hypothetical protein
LFNKELKKYQNIFHDIEKTGLSLIYKERTSQLIADKEKFIAEKENNLKTTINEIKINIINNNIKLSINKCPILIYETCYIYLETMQEIIKHKQLLLYPDIIKLYTDNDEEQIISLIIQIDGFDRKTAEYFAKGLDKFIELFNKLSVIDLKKFKIEFLKICK